jgi:hypothetical protein
MIGTTTRGSRPRSWNTPDPVPRHEQVARRIGRERHLHGARPAAYEAVVGVEHLEVRAGVVAQMPDLPPSLDSEALPRTGWGRSGKDVWMENLGQNLEPRDDSGARAIEVRRPIYRIDASRSHRTQAAPFLG